MSAGLCSKSGDAFDERDRLIEHFTKMARRPVCEEFEIGQAARLCNFPLEACNRSVRDAAGIDERKVAEIGRHVEGESVRSHAPSDMDSDGGDFAFPPCGRQRFGRDRCFTIEIA